MSKRFFILALVITSLSLNSTTLAEAEDISEPQLRSFRGDFEQPVQILADHDLLDLQQNIYRATGNVRINQGSIQITADELEVAGFDSRGDQPEIFSLRGSPATYQQEIEPGLQVHAQAHLILYDFTGGTLVLEGAAEFRQDGSIVRAERIVYNIQTQQVTSDRGEEQVETIFRPRPRQQN